MALRAQKFACRDVSCRWKSTMLEILMAWECLWFLWYAFLECFPSSFDSTPPILNSVNDLCRSWSVLCFHIYCGWTRCCISGCRLGRVPSTDVGNPHAQRKPSNRQGVVNYRLPPYYVHKHTFFLSHRSGLEILSSCSLLNISVQTAWAKT